MSAQSGYKALCGAILDMLMELKAGGLTEGHCPPSAACRGGDDGDFCKRCWQDAALARLGKGKKAAALPDATKQNYGEFGHVRLTGAEHARLCQDYGEQRTARAITLLDLHIGTKGKDPYANHSMAMRKWVFKALDDEDARQARARGNFATQNERNVEACRDWLDHD